MKITKNGEAKVIMSNPLSRFNYFAWPTATRLKNGKIAVGASGMRLGHLCPFGKAMLAYSEDEGETYSLPSAITDTPLDDRDVGLCPFGESGLILTSFTETLKIQADYAEKHYEDKSCFDYKMTMEYLKGLDREGDEKPYIGSNYRVSYDNGVTFGPFYKSPVTNPHGPTQLSDGSFLWIGTPFTPTEEVKASYQNVRKAEAYKINLDGTNEYLGCIDGIEVEGEKAMITEPYAIELDDGTILAHIRVEANKKSGVHTFTIFQTESKDKGRTWSEPRQIFDDFGGSPSHIMKHSSGALICSVSFRGDPWPTAPFGIWEYFSFDNGKTWEGPHEIHKIEYGTCDMGYPSTVELKDGSLLTTFYAHYPDENYPAVIMQQKWKFEK